jgi:curved DNA-binding protein CbpA
VKPLFEQDHYEVLEVSRNTSPEEIERAYRVAQATYAEDSLAGYSVFGEGDARAIRERVEAAYRVLRNADARRAYDATLGASKPEPEVEALPIDAPDAVRPESDVEELDAFEEVDEDSGDFDGPRLRRTRLRLGMELDEISGSTKINPAYLRFIEEERFGDLPARVYVRGFVSAYASCVGLDPERVTRSYMRRFEAVCPDPRRILFGKGP